MFTCFPRKNHKRTQESNRPQPNWPKRSLQSITLLSSFSFLLFSLGIFVRNSAGCIKCPTLSLSQTRRIVDVNEGRSKEIVSMTHLLFKIQFWLFQLFLFRGWWWFPTSFDKKRKQGDRDGCDGRPVRRLDDRKPNKGSRPTHWC